MKTSFIILLVMIATMALPSLQYRASSSLKGSKKADKEEFNIGLIAPHTNFGKREYLKAINSAVFSLQKLKDTKLVFLKDFSFAAANVHFDMMSLTPSPTSKFAEYNFFANLFNYFFFSNFNHNVQRLFACKCFGHSLSNEL